MIEQAIDLWEVEADVRCITTNGTVKDSGSNIMGGGCAYEAAMRFQWLPFSYGRAILDYGHRTFFFPQFGLVMFPTKERIEDPASLDTIERSAKELVALANIYGWQKIAVPRPGAGLGGLNWEDVKPVLEPLFDDRFIIIDFPK